MDALFFPIIYAMGNVIIRHRKHCPLRHMSLRRTRVPGGGRQLPAGPFHIVELHRQTLINTGKIVKKVLANKKEI